MFLYRGFRKINFGKILLNSIAVLLVFLTPHSVNAHHVSSDFLLSSNLEVLKEFISNEFVSPVLKSANDVGDNFSYITNEVEKNSKDRVYYYLSSDEELSLALMSGADLLKGYFLVGEHILGFSNSLLENFINLQEISGNGILSLSNGILSSAINVESEFARNTGNLSDTVISSTIIVEGNVGKKLMDFSSSILDGAVAFENFTGELISEGIIQSAKKTFVKDVVKNTATVFSATVSNNKKDDSIKTQTVSLVDSDAKESVKVSDDKIAMDQLAFSLRQLIDVLTPDKLTAVKKVEEQNIGVPFVSKAELASAIQTLSNTFNSRISNLSLSQSNNQSLAPIYQMISLSQKIDSIPTAAVTEALSNSSISSPTISGGSISGASISAATSLSISTSTAGCAEFSSSGELFSIGSNCSGGSGDITSVGDVTSGAAFDGTQGTTLTFFNAGGNATLDYDGTKFSFSKLIAFPYSSSTIYSSFNTASTTNILINGESFNDLTGGGLTNTGSALTLNLANANTWTVNQTFNYSSSTIYSSFATASTTSLYIGSGQGYGYVGSNGLFGVTSTSTLASQVFSATTFPLNSIITTNASGNLIATSSNYFTIGSFIATSTTLNSYSRNNWTGFGTTTPKWVLQIASSTRAQLALSDGSSTSNHWTFRVAGTAMYIGTSSAITLATSTTPAITFNATSATTTIGFFTSTTTGLVSGSGVSLVAQNLIIIGDGRATSSVAIVRGGLCVDLDGWCTAASTTPGYISGVVLSTGGSDLAENYYSNENLEPGYIVSPSSPVNYVVKSTNSNTMIGIVSTEPGVTLGGGPDYNGGGYPIALTGRVPVMVNNEGGEILVGDGITLSSVAGVGKKAEPGEIVIALALDSFDFSNESQGKVLGFVTKSVITPNISLSELNSNLEAIAGTLASSTLSSETFTKKFFQNIFSKIGEWFADSTNNLGNVFANAFNAKEKICVDGECLTKDDIRALLTLVNGGNVNSTPPPANTENGPELDTTSPDITISGENPVTITVGSSYVDFGATVEDTDDEGAVNNNLGIHYFINEVEVEHISIDTSTTSINTIIYRATDEAGNVGEASRVVNVVAE